MATTKTRKTKRQPDYRLIRRVAILDYIGEDGAEASASVSLREDFDWVDYEGTYRYLVEVDADGEETEDGADSLEEARSMMADRVRELRATDRERRNDLAADELQAVIDLLRERGQSAAALAALKAAGF